jgi:hypothetical protein
MKQKTLGIFVVALVAVLCTGPVSAGCAEWVTDDDQRIEIHAHADAMFFDENGESFDLAELQDGETRTFGEGQKQVTVARVGDVVTIVRDESEEKSKLEILCDTGRDTCKVITFSDDPEKVMIMIQKTRECVNGIGDCADVDIAIGDYDGQGGHAVIRTVKCDDTGNCEHFEKIGGGSEVITIREGGPHKMMFVHADEHGDQVLLRCPEGDSKIHVDKDEAADTFLCPKHSVPMVQEENQFIRKFKVKQR